MRKITTTLIMISICVTMNAQEEVDTLSKLKCLQKNQWTWTTQIAFSENKNKIEKIKTKFELYHPDKETEIYFDPPYWLLRAGNFETEIVANQFIETIINWYPDAFSLRVKKNKKGGL